ncbi:PLP-dependent cysteine synthase family protein [Exiguobacterium sp. UBA7533]|uniref:PLP-dependent cysteine synthase family protein n=1 Tax=Exiguobacterium sp. UBA7533 TaxID=1946501 RepID=UPI0025BD3682|nr:cysteine synthase family protein [Exiguobacterium sp. UBA7533]
MIANNVRDLVGNTPLYEIISFDLPAGTRILAKLEWMNPGGSVKDRLGIQLVDAAIENGHVTPGGTIIEPTAGNTGIGLALAAKKYDLQVICVVPEKFSQEKQTLMRALGATVVNTPTELDMQGAIDRAKELGQEIPNSYVPLQFENEENPVTYQRTLGPELIADLPHIDWFVAGCGSGGTFAGTADFLKQRLGTKAAIVEPEGSVLNGGPAGPHKTEGIGTAKWPSLVPRELVDEIHTISDRDAFDAVHTLAAREGLLVGSSAGAALVAALDIAKRHPGSTIVTVFADSAERYLSQQIFEKVDETHA